MKKFYTLIAATCLAFGVTAQSTDYDVTVAWATISEGSTNTTNPIDLSYTLTNNGDVELTSEDTIYYGYTVDGAAADIDLAGGVSIGTLVDPLAPGASITLGASWNFASATNIEVCAIVYGIGIASLVGHAGDSNSADNTTCATIDVTDGFDVGVEEFELTLSNVYVSAGDLILVNDGAISPNTQANLNIYNLNGQVVQTQNFVINQGNTTLDVSTLTAGIYIVAVEVDGAVITRKVSIQ